MSGPKDPKVVIPPYDVPPGTIFTYVSPEGVLTWQKQADGTYSVINFDRD